MTYFCGGTNCFMFRGLIFVLLAPYIHFHILVEWPPIRKIAAHLAYDIFS